MLQTASCITRKLLRIFTVAALKLCLRGIRDGCITEEISIHLAPFLRSSFPDAAHRTVDQCLLHAHLGLR